MIIEKDMKIVVKATVVPVHALRCIEVKIPTMKCKCWCWTQIMKKGQYRFYTKSKYRLKK